MIAEHARAIAGVALVAVSLAGIALAGRAARRDLMVLWPLAALALFLLLFPPGTRWRGDRLTVLAPGVTAGQRDHLPVGQPVVLLPGVDPVGDAEAAPDRATALRRHASVQALDLFGDGLPRRDREALHGVVVHLHAPPAFGLTSIDAAPRALSGAAWIVSGRVAEAGATVQLLDPAGGKVDAATADGSGHFQLRAAPRGDGPQTFVVREVDDKQAVRDWASVPVVAEPGRRLRLLIRAGAPDPDLKVLRRWAADAGFAVGASAGLSEHVAQEEGATTLDDATLDATDAVLIDERAWSVLQADEKARLLAAVDRGLGLLLRVRGVPDPTVLGDWSTLGFPMRPLDAARGVALDRRTGGRDALAFTAAPVAVEAAAGSGILLADDGGIALAWSRDRGKGRIAVWLPTDTFKLSLSGAADAYAALWSDVLGGIARAQARARDTLPVAAGRVDRRSELCDAGPAGKVAAPGGATPIDLVIAESGCAAFWPGIAGWHRLRTARGEVPFFVRAPDDGAGLQRAEDRRDTEALQAGEGAGATAGAAAFALSRWTLFVLFLAAAGALWLRERG